MTSTDTDLRAADVAWDLEPLVDGRGEAGVDALLDEAEAKVFHIAESGARGGQSFVGLPVLLEKVVERIEENFLKLVDGDVVDLATHDGAFIARGLWNPASRIRVERPG